jgi:hypothetical protein
MRKRLGTAMVGVIVALALTATPIFGSGTSRAGAASTPRTWAPGCNGEPYTWSQHPSGIGLTCDGVAIIEKVRWRHWGDATAQATGTLNAAQGCTPSCATAPRRHYAVTILASSIGYCGNRRVYGKITVHYKQAGHLRTITQPTFCSPTGQRPTPHPASMSVPSNPSEFRAQLAGGYFGCAVNEGGQTLCQGVPTTSQGSEPLVQVAKLQPDGQVTSCTEHQGTPVASCFEGNLGDPIPYLSPGQASTVGPFTCTVLKAGVECTVAATRKGFLITPESVTEIGG